MTIFIAIFAIIFVAAMIFVAFWLADQRGKKPKPHTEHHQTPGNEDSVRIKNKKGKGDRL